jgi:hypothetical protein
VGKKGRMGRGAPHRAPRWEGRGRGDPVRSLSEATLAFRYPVSTLRRLLGCSHCHHEPMERESLVLQYSCSPLLGLESQRVGPRSNTCPCRRTNGQQKALYCCSSPSTRQKANAHFGTLCIDLRYPGSVLEKVVYLSLGCISCSVGSASART